MLCVYEKQYYAIHALCGDLNDFEKEGNILRVGTFKPGLAETYKKLGYREIIQECAEELGIDVKVEIIQKQVVKTKEQIVKERLTAIFGKEIIFEK